VEFWQAAVLQQYEALSQGFDAVLTELLRNFNNLFKLDHPTYCRRINQN